MGERLQPPANALMKRIDESLSPYGFIGEATRPYDKFIGNPYKYLPFLLGSNTLEELGQIIANQKRAFPSHIVINDQDPRYKKLTVVSFYNNLYTPSIFYGVEDVSIARIESEGHLFTKNARESVLLWPDLREMAYRTPGLVNAENSDFFVFDYLPTKQLREGKARLYYYVDWLNNKATYVCHSTQDYTDYAKDFDPVNTLVRDGGEKPVFTIKPYGSFTIPKTLTSDALIANLFFPYLCNQLNYDPDTDAVTEDEYRIIADYIGIQRNE